MRRLATVLAAVLAMVTFGWLFGRAMDYEFHEIDRRNCDARPVEGSPCDHDGRLHPCGWVTEDGVTEYLDTYAERCPEDVTTSTR